MKKFLIAVIVMLTGLTAWAEENVPVLQFYMYDGSVVRMELPGKTTMKVKKGLLTVGTTEVNLKNVKRYTITSSSGVTTPEETANQVRIFPSIDGVVIAGLEAGQTADLYDLQGRKLNTVVADGRLAVELTAPATGIYVVRAAGLTFKVAIKK